MRFLNDILKAFVYENRWLLMIWAITILVCCGLALAPEASAATKPKDRLILFNPSAKPSGIPIAPGKTKVIFKALVGGTSNPPKKISLDELDLKGVAKHVVYLIDNGKGSDEKAGDFVYTGVLEIPSGQQAEKYYRVSAKFKDQMTTSGTATIGITSFPLVARDSDRKKLVKDPKSTYWLFSNEVVIMVFPGVSADRKRIERIEKAVDGKVVGVIPALQKYLLEIRGDKSAAGVYKVTEYILKTFNKEVKKAHPNYLVVDQALPSETPSGCTNTASNCQWYIEHVDIDKAWELAGGGSIAPPVAVIELSGIKGTHQDLQNKCQAGGAPAGEDPCNASYTHGTMVAGVLAAEPDDGGIVGVAYGTKLKSYKYNETTYLLSAAIDAVDVKIINLSLAVGNVISTEIQNAICRGALIIAAAGNVGPTCPSSNNKYPAVYNNDQTTILNCPDSYTLPLNEGILAVGATDIDNNLALWGGGCSNSANWIDIYAPGKDIYTTTLGGTGYTHESGTSFAAPIVSGAAAIVWALKPEWTAKDIHDRIVESATILKLNSTCNPPCDSRFVTGDPRMQGKKLINVLAALGAPSDLNLSPSNPSIKEDCSDIAGSGNQVATVSAIDIDGTDETFAYSFVDDAGNSVSASGPFQIDPSGTITVETGCPLDFETASSHSIKVRVVDSTELTFEKELIITVTNVNETPTITGVSDQVILESTAAGPLPFTLHDDDTPAAMLNVTGISSNPSMVSNTDIGFSGIGSIRTVTVTPVAGQTGTTTIMLTVTDGDKSASTNFDIMVTTWDPIITFKYQETHQGSDGNLYDYYHIQVANWPVYPPGMFAITSQFGPCGLNPTPSRTWVDIFNAVNNSRIYGFCGFDSPDDLTEIWFAVPAGHTPPANVYIELHDRQNDIRHRSNTLAIP